jgi:hypothetical protein
MTKIGPHTRRRRHVHLARLAFWISNLVAALTLYFVARSTFDKLAVPYLLAISLGANIEGAWSSYAADSPLDE